MQLVQLKEIEIQSYDQAMQPTYKDVVLATVQNDKGETIDLKMNIFKPRKSNGPTPVLIYIHGGAFEKHDYTQRTHTNVLSWQRPLSLLEQGITVVFIGYRLSQEAIFPAQIHDVKGAVRYLKAHADEYGLDPEKMMIWGQSAGAHLAALLATTGDLEELEGEVGGNLEFSSRVKSSVLLYPITDFFKIEDDRKEYFIAPPEESVDLVNTPESRLFGFSKPGQGIQVLKEIWENQQTDSPFWEKARLVHMANPITWVTKESAPVLIVNGGMDYKVPWKQSLRLFEAYSRSGAEAAYFTDSRMGHTPPTRLEMSNAIFQFVLEQLL